MKKSKRVIKKRRIKKVTYPVIEQSFNGRQSEEPIPYEAETQQLSKK